MGGGDEPDAGAGGGDEAEVGGRGDARGVTEGEGQGRGVDPLGGLAAVVLDAGNEGAVFNGGAQVEVAFGALPEAPSPTLTVSVVRAVFAGALFEARVADSASVASRVTRVGMQRSPDDVVVRAPEVMVPEVVTP